MEYPKSTSHIVDLLLFQLTKRKPSILINTKTTSNKLIAIAFLIALFAVARATVLLKISIVTKLHLDFILVDLLLV